MGWKVEKFDMSFGGQGIQVVDEAGTVICDNEPYYPSKLDPKHAHLIAAAPAMLEALIKSQKALALIVEPNAIKQSTVLNAFAQVMAAEAAVRVAIAAAEAQP